MKKINFKNILTKTFNKKSKIKKKLKKPVKKKTIIKKVAKNKIKKKKIIKVSKKKIKKKEAFNLSEIKTENLRIVKNNEQKPEIKKIKTQGTEKKEYKIKDYVVYPKHGVGQIMEFKKISIGGIEVETYILKFEKDKANGMVPINKQSHLRPLATINQVNKTAGRQVYEENDGGAVKTVPYKRNTFVMFLNTPNAIHSVSLRQNPTQWRRSVNIIGEFKKNTGRMWRVQEIKS